MWSASISLKYIKVYHSTAKSQASCSSNAISCKLINLLFIWSRNTANFSQYIVEVLLNNILTAYDNTSLNNVLLGKWLTKAIFDYTNLDSDSVNILEMHVCKCIRDKLSCTCLQNYTIGASPLGISIRIHKPNIPQVLTQFWIIVNRHFTTVSVSVQMPELDNTMSSCILFYCFLFSSSYSLYFQYCSRLWLNV